MSLISSGTLEIDLKTIRDTLDNAETSLYIDGTTTVASSLTVPNNDIASPLFIRQSAEHGGAEGIVQANQPTHPDARHAALHFIKARNKHRFVPNL